MISPINQINYQGYYIKPSVLKQKQKEQTNEIQLSGYQTGQGILARNNICFKQHERILTKSFSCNLKVVDEQIPLYISVEITSNSDIPAKQGLKSIYLMLVNGEIFDEKNNKFANFIASGIDINQRGLVLSCSPNDVPKVLKMIDSDFINLDIKDSSLRDLKQVASAWLFLSRKTDEHQNVFKDIPADMSEEEYEKLISEFTKEDIQKLHADIIKNSDININVVVNKNDYKNHEDEINSSIERLGY